MLTGIKSTENEAERDEEVNFKNQEPLTRGIDKLALVSSELKAKRL